MLARCKDVVSIFNYKWRLKIGQGRVKALFLGIVWFENLS
jgi:hypothetical protein